MNLTNQYARTIVYVLAGLAAGFVVFLMLRTFDLVRNPLWTVLPGGVIGALLSRPYRDNRTD